MPSAPSGGKANSGQRICGQQNAKSSFVNKFSISEHEESREVPKGSGYPKRDRRLIAKAAESDEQNKKKKTQTVYPSSHPPHK